MHKFTIDELEDILETAMTYKNISTDVYENIVEYLELKKPKAVNLQNPWQCPNCHNLFSIWDEKVYDNINEKEIAALAKFCKDCGQALKEHD
jgi:ribosomal protein S27AE